MQVFRDAKNREWEVRVNGGTIKRVLDLLDVDLGKMMEGTPPLLTRLHTDVVFIVDLIYAVMKPQLDKVSVDAENFYELLEGEAACQARDAVLEELALFFQTFGQTTIAVAIRKQREIVEEANRRGVDVIDGAAMAEQIATAMGGIDQALAPGSAVAK